MISVNNLRQNTFFKQDGNIFQVFSFSHIKVGRGGAIVKTKVKNLITGSLTEKSFKATDSVEETIIDRKKGQFLFSDNENCYFMDEITFEQYNVPKAIIGQALKFLKEAVTVQLIIFEDKVINVELPIKEVYQVTATDPGLKGDTVSGGSKPATIETGATILVPLFIKIGDKIRVNTLEGKYVERTN